VQQVVWRALGPTLAAMALVLALSSPAIGADDRVEEARRHYLQGNAYYRLDKFREALGEYELAYIAKPDPSFLYNIAQCHRLMGNKPEALKYYRRFIKDQSHSPNRPIAEKHIRDIERSGVAAAPPSGATPPATATAGTQLAAPAPAPAPAPPPASSASSSAPTTAPPSPPTLALAPAPPLDGADDIAGAAVLNGGGDQPPGERDNGSSSGAFYTRWWFWAAVGAVLITGAVVAVAARGDPCEDGRVCR
jgi:hypothetical protein